MKRKILLSPLAILILIIVFGVGIAGAAIYFGGAGSTGDVSLQKGLVGWWKFDGNAKDATANSNHGTVTGATLTTDRKGTANKAYSFDGSSNYITVTDADSFEMGTGDFTISSWVNVNASIANGELNTILAKRAQNQVLRSEEFDNGSWTSYCDAGTMTANTTDVTAPDGTNTAEKLVSAGGASCGSGGYAGRIQTISTASNTQYTISIWVRGAAGGESFYMSLQDSVPLCSYALTTAWVRYTCTITSAATPNRGFQFYIVSPGVVSTFYIWGAQREMADSAGIYTQITSSSISTSGYSLLMDNTALKAAIYSTTAGGTVTYGSLTTGAWHHVAAVYSRTGNVILYVDGVSVGTTDISAFNGVSITNARNLLIGGATPETINDFKGSIDDARIYNRALSAEEISDLYNEYDPGIVISDLQKGLMGNWKFNGNAKDATVNSNHGTVTGATLTTDRKGTANKAYSFDGINNYIDTNSSITLGTTFTIASWFKTGDGTGGIISNAAASTGLTVGWQFGTGSYVSWYNYLNFSAYAGCNYNSSLHGITASSNSYLDNQWHYGVVTGDGTNWRLYVDGVQLAITSESFDLPECNTTVKIGVETNQVGWNTYLSGSLDEVRIYNRALSAAEVSDLYNEYDPGIVISDLQKGLMGNWKFNGNAKDSTANSNHGTLTGTTLTTDRKGTANKAYSFNGVDGTKISISDNNLWTLSGDFAISLWANLATLTQGNWWTAAFVAQDVGGGTNNKWIFAWDAGTDKLTFHMVNTSPSSSFQISSNVFSAAISTWYYITLVRSGNDYTFYKNGVAIGTVTQVGTIPNAATPLTIGWGEGTGSFNGSIDDVRIYNRALSQTEITALYQSY